MIPSGGNRTSDRIVLTLKEAVCSIAAFVGRRGE
jgi:hypothetical protein